LPDRDHVQPAALEVGGVGGHVAEPAADEAGQHPPEGRPLQLGRVVPGLLPAPPGEPDRGQDAERDAQPVEVEEGRADLDAVGGWRRDIGQWAHRSRTSPTALSTAVSTSSSRVRPAAAQFSSICSGRVAPTIAEATFGSRSTHARASCAIDRPASAATTRRRSTASSTSSVRKWPTNMPILRLAARLSGGRASPLRYLPVSTPWASGDQTTWPTPS